MDRELTLYERDVAEMMTLLSSYIHECKSHQINVKFRIQNRYYLEIGWADTISDACRDDYLEIDGNGFPLSEFKRIYIRKYPDFESPDDVFVKKAEALFDYKENCRYFYNTYKNQIEIIVSGNWDQ